MIFKRSIYASVNIKKGEKFTINNIKVVRPSFGVPPKYFSQILGMKSLQNIKKASPIKKNFYRK